MEVENRKFYSDYIIFLNSIKMILCYQNFVETTAL